jgi:hypothetical protein
MKRKSLWIKERLWGERGVSSGFVRKWTLPPILLGEGSKKDVSRMDADPSPQRRWWTGSHWMIPVPVIEIRVAGHNVGVNDIALKFSART